MDLNIANKAMLDPETDTSPNPIQIMLNYIAAPIKILHKQANIFIYQSSKHL